MRKTLYPLLIIAILTAAASFGSCRKGNGDTGNGNDPQTMDINDFAAYFADLAARNMRDSLYQVYPDVRNADSISFAPAGKPFAITDLGGGKYEIVYSPTLKILVEKDPQGHLTVTETFGLFAYDSIQSSLASRSGLKEVGINDVELARRMNDTDFFRYLAEKSQIKTTDILQVGAPVYNSTDGITGYVPILNLTDSEVAGEDFMISLHSMTDHNGQEENQLMMVAGRDIAPNDTIRVEVVNAPYHVLRVNGVKFKLSQEELSEKYAPLTGNEYREYLEGKREEPQGLMAQ